MTKSAHSMDSFDRRLLTELQRDSARKAEELADIVGLSPSAIRRRTRRLRESGAILGEVALVDRSLAGVEIVVAITMRDEDRSAYDRLKRRMRVAPEVSQCYSVTGEVDMIAHVHMPDMTHYESWIDENILADDAVRRCTSHVIYSRIKYSTAVKLAPD